MARIQHNTTWSQHLQSQLLFQSDMSDNLLHAALLPLSPACLILFLPHLFPHPHPPPMHRHDLTFTSHTASRKSFSLPFKNCRVLGFTGSKCQARAHTHGILVQRGGLKIALRMFPTAAALVCLTITAATVYGDRGI